MGFRPSLAPPRGGAPPIRANGANHARSPRASASAPPSPERAEQGADAVGGDVGVHQRVLQEVESSLADRARRPSLALSAKLSSWRRHAARWCRCHARMNHASPVASGASGARRMRAGSRGGAPPPASDGRTASAAPRASCTDCSHLFSMGTARRASTPRPALQEARRGASHELDLPRASNADGESGRGGVGRARAGLTNVV